MININKKFKSERTRPISYGMKNINKFSTVFALFVMVFAIFGMLGFAESAKAEIVYSDYVGGGMRNVVYEYDPVVPNPRPSVYSVNPNPIKAGSGATTVTVVGDNFVNGAVVKINNFDRSTTFASKTRLTVEVLASDLARVGDKVITVYNPGPGGGLSNGVILSVVGTSSSGSVAGASTSTKSPAKKVVTKPVGEVLGDEDCVPSDEEAGASDLAAGVIVGDGGFFPGSLVGWLILIVLILLLVILIRRMFGLEKKYHESPLKHA